MQINLSYRLLAGWISIRPFVTCELEDYCVNFNGVTVPELRLISGISGGNARASLGECGVSLNQNRVKRLNTGHEPLWHACPAIY